MSGLIDYAGLFPPAELPMRSAVENYVAYSLEPDADSLGRLIVPAARLGELEEAAGDLIPRGKGSAPLRIAALVAGDVKPVVDRLLEFNCSHAPESAKGHALIDVVEVKAARPEDIAPARMAIPDFFTPYFELPIEADIGTGMAETKKAGARAKIRTGGVTAAAFPSTAHVLRFLRAALSAGIAFKATAGLHHPIRSAYRYTYEPESDRGMMFGFLNVFLAAAFLRAGADDDSAARILEETDSMAFRFGDAGVSWRGRSLATRELADTRSSFAISFGSCSFREPVDEMKQLTRSPALT